MFRKLQPSSQARGLGCTAGAVSAVAGSAVFSILGAVLFIMTGSPSSFDKLEIARIWYDLAFLVPIILIYSIVLSILPGGLMGMIIGWLLHRQKISGVLTPARGITTGILAAGFAGLGVCLVALLIMVSFPHAYWKTFWHELLSQPSFKDTVTYIVDDLYHVMQFAVHQFPFIVTVVIIACAAGGLAGRWISFRLLAGKASS